MRIAEINMVDYGSTGNIMLQIADRAREKGYDVYTFSKRWRKQQKKNEFHFYYGSTFENGIHVLLSRAIGFQGMFSYFGTKQLVNDLKNYKPDIIHLHNLHDSSTCLPVLFGYIKKNNVRTVWTLHDCWPMTGACPYFTMAKCDKWKKGCYACPQKLSALPIDCSKPMWKRKRELFSGLDMILVTPSEWLEGLVKQSFLNTYPVKVIHNGVDLSVFRPVRSNFRKVYELEEKKIILGVASNWGARKGLDVFIELSKRFDLKKYQIVLAGTDNDVDKRLPNNIISIHRTQSQQELAEIYTAADLFVNPTREENYPTVNMEALACGTPVLTFQTGGSPEIIDDSCGSAVDCDCVDALEKEIQRICTMKPYSVDACLKRAESFDMRTRFKEYVNLYEDCTCRTELPLQ